MASETAAPTPVSKWTDTEKIALLISVIKASGGKVKWADVAVPAGRTTQSAAKMYSEMMKASAAVAMTGGADILPSKKRARKNATVAAADDVGGDGATTAPMKKKRVRKPKVVAEAAVRPVEDDEDEDEEESHDKKKVKVEAEDEDEDGDFYSQA